MTLTVVAEGMSRIRETVFEDRFSHTMELIRLGAKITIAGDTAAIEGVPRLTGTTVMASDIRAGAALVAAGLAAEGETVIKRIYHIDRGYENLEDGIRELDGDMAREQE
jgi:UDP-N-acetylglucosamine 1-carboxyvinyltransferase